MILAASFEFDRRNNPEIVDRESDNAEIPQVSLRFLREPKMCLIFPLASKIS